MTKAYPIKGKVCLGCAAKVEKMIAAKLPIVRGTMKNRTKRDIYLGNGDTMIVGGRRRIL